MYVFIDNIEEGLLNIFILYKQETNQTYLSWENMLIRWEARHSDRSTNIALFKRPFILISGRSFCNANYIHSHYRYIYLTSLCYTAIANNIHSWSRLSNNTRTR